MTSENLPLVVAQTESRKDVINAAVSEALNSRVPDGSQMQSGRVYVGRLPGHGGPVFVRRRKKSFCNPFGVPSVTSMFAPPTASPMEYQCNTATICQPQPPSPVFIAQASAYTTPPQAQPPQLQLHTMNFSLNKLPPSTPALHVGNFDLLGTSTAIHWRQARLQGLPFAENVSSSTRQVKNLMKLNVPAGRRGSARLADKSIASPIHPMSGAARLVMKSAEDIIAIGPQTKAEGIEEPPSQVQVSALGSTLFDHQKRDVGQGAPWTVSASFVESEQVKTSLDLSPAQGIVMALLMAIIATRITTLMNTLKLMTSNIADVRGREA
ncbi:MAG: hypothetical protein Q9225_002110 [Loekoesia sp. 1 TL-2023]